jgi:hypothetical protein
MGFDFKYVFFLQANFERTKRLRFILQDISKDSKLRNTNVPQNETRLIDALCTIIISNKTDRKLRSLGLSCIEKMSLNDSFKNKILQTLLSTMQQDVDHANDDFTRSSLTFSFKILDKFDFLQDISVKVHC